jgi:hypothetical protein
MPRLLHHAGDGGAKKTVRNHGLMTTTLIDYMAAMPSAGGSLPSAFITQIGTQRRSQHSVRNRGCREPLPGRRWCRANNHRLTGPNGEIYGHWQREWDADPSRTRTDVYYLVCGGADL